MPERFDKAARAGDSAKGLVHYRNRLQKARLRRRGNARKIAMALTDILAMSVMHTCFRGPPFVGISPQGRTLKLALIHANCRSLFYDYNSEQARRLRKKLLLARLRACQGVDGTE